MTSADEATVVLVDEAKGDEGEEIREKKVDGEIGISVRDEVEPVTLFGGIARSRVIEAAPVIVGFVTNADVVLNKGISSMLGGISSPSILRHDGQNRHLYTSTPYIA